MRKVLFAAIIAAFLAVVAPSIVYADGCNSSSCTSSGTNWELRWYGYYGCNWTYTGYFNGSWFYEDCHGSSSQFYL